SMAWGAPWWHRTPPEPAILGQRDNAIRGMAEIRTVTTLRAKRAEIISAIAQYEKRLAQARADLSHVNACIALFEASSEPGALTPYIDTHRLFARGELMALCKDALAS